MRAGPLQDDSDLGMGVRKGKAFQTEGTAGLMLGARKDQSPLKAYRLLVGPDQENDEAFRAGAVPMEDFWG